MSHSATDPLQHPSDRALWMPITDDEHRNGVGSYNDNDRASRNANNAASLTPGEEHDRLLAADQATSHRHPSSSPAQHSRFDVEDNKFFTPATWLPRTLRRPYLSALAIISLALAVFLAVISSYSLRNHGIRDDDGSVGLFFARRYIPTMIAVFFTLAISMIAEDIKRTEAFARMASPKPPTAKHTLFYVPKAWWKNIFHGLSPKRNGGQRRWVLSVSSFAVGVSLLIISTFSSSIFVTKQIFLQTEAQLQLYTTQQDGSVSLVPRRATYSRTISSFLYNRSTSLWVSDSYVVLPFTLPTKDSPHQSLSDGVWEVETKVMKLESDCVQMNIVEKTALNITLSDGGDCNGTCTRGSRGFRLRSEDGCEIQMQSPIAPTSQNPTGGTTIEDPRDGYFTDKLSLRGGAMWTNLSSSHITWQRMMKDQGEAPRVDSSEEIVHDQWRRTFFYDISDKCLGRELLLVSPPWFDKEQINLMPPLFPFYTWDNFTARAEICTPTYYEADMPVTAVVGGTFPQVSIQDAEFARRRKPIAKESLDLEIWNGLSFGKAWSKYMTAPLGEQNLEGLEGAPMLLAKAFSFNGTEMMDTKNGTLPSQASRLRSRFFGEVVLSSIFEADVPSTKDTSGSFTRMETRIVVIFGVGIALAVLFFLAACYLSAMFWYASDRTRPLDLSSDPATTAGTASLIKTVSGLAADLRSWNDNDRSQIKEKIGARVYTLSAGTLSEQRRVEDVNEIAIVHQTKGQSDKRESAAKNLPRHDWRPSMLHKRWLVALLAGLIAVITILLVLRRYADKGLLFQAAFVQQFQINQLHVNFSAHSLIATLVAVLIGLCWDGIDKALRTLQPYLAMSRAPCKPSQGIAVSYESSYWAWASIKSARSKHWMLCLITIGTTLAQILTVSMAAIFERQTIIREITLQNDDTMTPSRLQTIRQEPFTFGPVVQHPFYIPNTLIETSESDWLYSALDEITLDASAPTWTKDEWAFTPVSFEPSKYASRSGYTNKTSESKYQSKAEFIESSVNVSFITPAVRIRLECNPVKLPTTGWLDRPHDVFPLHINESTDGYVLPELLSDKGLFETPVFTIPRRMACCTNGTSSGGQSIIAYWSSNNTINQKPILKPATENVTEKWVDTSVWYKQFAIKWIVGPTSSTTVPGTRQQMSSNSFGQADETLLYFTEEPRVTVMYCNPVIEQAAANVTLARYTNQILEYDFVGDIQPASGAWDYAYNITWEEIEENVIHINDTYSSVEVGSDKYEGNVSYGALFMSQLLTAPHIIEPPRFSSELVANGTLEDLSSERFAIRDKSKGLNMDFLSYANYILAASNATALLDHDVLRAHSETTMQTFFKHFVASGKWYYGGHEKAAVYEDVLGSGTQVTDGSVAERVEVLTMNRVATWLSLGIIFLLMGILVVLVVSLQLVYPGSYMQRHVECLADVLVMVAGSDELVGMVHKVGVEGMGRADVKTRLGWFRDRRGDVRWGVEIVGADGVEWVNGPGEGLEKEGRGQRS